MGQEHKEYTWNLIAKKLSGEASPEELQELERLLRSNPELHYPLQTITDLWSPAAPARRKEAEQAFKRHLDRMQDLGIDFIPPTPPSEELPEPGEDPLIQYRTGTRRRRTLLVAAACCLLATAVIVANYIPARSPLAGQKEKGKMETGSEVSAGAGSRTQLVLPDGTKVWLNAGSRINYDKNFGTSLREVTLTGEAFFDVVRNAGKPFVIHTERIDIRVLGTRFNVKSYPADKTTEATLINGSIEVSVKDRPSEKIILKPNEKLVVANDDSTLHRKDPGLQKNNTNESLVTIRKPTYEQATGAIIETSWVENKLVFQDEEFGTLARQMERWYGIGMRFDNPALEQLRFTGNFQKETIRQALDALKLTDPLKAFNYTIHENQVTIYDK